MAICLCSFRPVAVVVVGVGQKALRGNRGHLVGSHCLILLCGLAVILYNPGRGTVGLKAKVIVSRVSLVLVVVLATEFVPWLWRGGK